MCSEGLVRREDMYQGLPNYETWIMNWTMPQKHYTAAEDMSVAALANVTDTLYNNPEEYGYMLRLLDKVDWAALYNYRLRGNSNE